MKDGVPGSVGPADTGLGLPVVHDIDPVLVDTLPGMPSLGRASRVGKGDYAMALAIDPRSITPTEAKFEQFAKAFHDALPGAGLRSADVQASAEHVPGRKGTSEIRSTLVLVTQPIRGKVVYRQRVPGDTVEDVAARDETARMLAEVAATRIRRMLGEDIPDVPDPSFDVARA